MKKILHINSNYLLTPLHEKLVERLFQFGYDNEVYMPTHGSHNYVINIQNYVNVSNAFKKVDRLFYLIKETKIYQDIKVKFNVKNYDLIHAHTLFTDGYVAYKLNKEYSIPYIVAVRNTDVNLFFKFRKYLNWLGNDIINHAEKVIFLSDKYKQDVCNKYLHGNNLITKACVIPNGIDDFWLNNKYLRKSPNTIDKKLNLIFVGLVNKNKNVLTAIKAAQMLSGEFEIKFKIIGKVGSQKLLEQALKYNFVEHISFCKKEELINYYREADLFVMPSKYETFGLVYAEALSQSLPVIFTKNQGFDGNFKDGEVGYAVLHNDKDEIVKAILNISKNYNEIIHNCYINSEIFSWSNVAELYNDIYKSIIC